MPHKMTAFRITKDHLRQIPIDAAYWQCWIIAADGHAIIGQSRSRLLAIHYALESWRKGGGHA